MLIHLDETLHHQASRPFRMVGVSDHRFFDRYWFEALDPAGEVAVIAGLAFYKNMGTCDGFVSVQRHHWQHNLRLARPLTDDIDRTQLGPLEVTVIEPFRHLRLRLGSNDSGMALDLEWRSDFPPYAEAHHLDVEGARVTQDSTRYDQVGRWDGWVELDDERFEADDWWGVRDHSWGIRPGVGGFELPAERAEPRLWIWACFSTSEWVCQFQLREDGAGNRTYFDGQLDHRLDDGRASVRALDVSHDISFIAGTRAYDHARHRLILEDGRVLEVEAEPLGRAWAYRGTGYSNGYHDGRGLGAWRGDVVEHDVYDLSHPEDVLVDGSPAVAGHREQPVRLVVDGAASLGHLPVMTRGAIARYNLA